MLNISQYIGSDKNINILYKLKIMGLCSSMHHETDLSASLRLKAI